MKPGIASRPWRSITSVLSPTNRLISEFNPTARIVDPRSSFASASGRAESTVTIRPLRRTSVAASPAGGREGLQATASNAAIESVRGFIGQPVLGFGGRSRLYINLTRDLRARE